jgi:hypothetical protein
MSVPRGRHTATLLANGTVLVTGGNGNSGVVHSSAEIFNPNSGPNGRGTFQPTVSGMLSQRNDHAAALLSNGHVLISGGLTDGNCCYPKPPTATMEFYDPALGFFAAAGSSLVSRYVHAATAVSGDRVLLSGTWGWSSAGGRLAEVVDVAARPRLNNLSTVRGQSGAAYSFTLFPEGGAGGPYVIDIVSGRLPGGIVYNSGTQTFSGIPTESGTFPISVSLTDGAGTTVFQALTIGVDTLLITTVSTLNTALQGVPYMGVGLSAQGIGSVTWAITSGSLPDGLSLNAADGSITGTPTVSCCSYVFTVRATDAAGQTAVQTFTIPVQAPLNATTTSLPIWTAGETPFGCVAVNGGVGNRTFSLSGTYPIGLSILNSGCFDSAFPSRVLRQGGAFTFTVHVSDSSVPVQTDSQSFTVSVHAQDQTPSWQGGTADVAVPDTRRLAQIYRSSSPYPLSGVHVFSNLTCNPGVVVTAQAWTPAGAPSVPSGGPLATAQVTTDPSGYVGMLVFPSPITIPRGAQFAITIDANGPCTVRNWATNHFYRFGDSLVDDGDGWISGRAAVGREDLPFTTLVLPPITQRFFATWRGGASVVTLADSRVLVAGPDQFAEIYDPFSSTITLTGAMNTARTNGTATLLANGRVLVAGGQTWNGSQNVSLNTTEIFDPATATFSAGPTMADGRYDHVATTLDDGRVLITGGRDTNFQSVDSAVLFDATGANPIELTMTGARARHTATLLADGRVFILGGWTGNPFPPRQSEIFDPGNNTFTQVEGGVAWWPSDHTATLLVSGPNAGQVLVAGGAGNYPQLPASTSLFNPQTLQFAVSSPMQMPRIEHAATRLSDGRVVFTGGAIDWSNWITTSQVEIYNPLTNQFALAGELNTDMASHSAVWTSSLGQERVVVGGGWGSGSLASRAGDVYDPVAANALAITTVMLPDGQVGQEYNGTGQILLNAVNCQPICDWTLDWGSLPPGLSLGSGELVSNGGLTAAGVYSFVLRVTDASRTATRAFTITVNRLAITTSGILPAGTIGTPYSIQLTGSGGNGGYTWSTGSALPAGLSLGSSGLLNGTPANAGLVSFEVILTDASGQVARLWFSLTINGAP